MRKLYIIGMTVLAGVAMTGCDSLLDDNRYPLDQQTNNPEFWSNAANVEGQTNYMYENFTGYGNGSGSGVFYFRTLNDDQGGGVGGSFVNWTYTAAPSSSTNWSAPYREIRRSNLVIEGVASGTLPEKDKAHYTAIARLMRAYQYYLLVRAYGDVPLVDKVIDASDEEALYGPRTSRNTVVDFMLEDLNYAKDNISAQKSKTTWSRDLANAIKAEICLFEGAYAKYHQNDKARSDKYFNEVVNACTPLMGSYSLAAKYSSLYQSVRTEMNSNPEVIFAKMYEKDVLMHCTIDYTSSSTPIAGLNRDAFDAYLFKDGKPKALTSENTSDVAEIIPGTDGNPDVYSIQKQLDVRDGRLAETIWPELMYVNHGVKYPNTMAMTSNTGYGVRKYNDTRIPYDYSATIKNYNCAPLYWLAEIYLAYAEAKAELGSLTDGDLNSSINKLYARAGLPAQTVSSLSSMNDPANNMNVSSLIWEIRRCRRCELIMDKGIRYWDLIRWHQLELLDTTKHPNIAMGANVTGCPVQIGNIGGYINVTYGLQRVFSDREYLYPVPTYQIQLNKQLTQNPGWSVN